MLYNLLTCLSITLDNQIHSFSLDTSLQIVAHELVCLSIPNQFLGKDASLEKYAHKLVCLSIHNKPTNNQSNTYSLNVYLGNNFLFFFKHSIFKLKLLDDFCRWVFDPEGRPLNL